MTLKQKLRVCALVSRTGATTCTTVNGLLQNMHRKKKIFFASEQKCGVHGRPAVGTRAIRVFEIPPQIHEVHEKLHH